MAHAIAADDIVRTHEEAAANERPPLLVLDPLLAFLDGHGIGEGEPEIEPIGDGHSNATYAVRRGGAEFVLRRPPRPPIPPSANDMLREARVLRALEGRARVPRVLAVCDDESVIGAPFYLLEKVDGLVVTTEVPPELDSAGDRRRMGEELVDALVEIHAIDWRAAGLEGFGKPDGYLERQLRRFLGLWEHYRTREIPAVESVAQWLKANLPESPPATIVHGDYRLGNTMMAAQSPARVVAVLDWEMSTIGDPLADLGYLCTLWVDHDDPPLGMFELSGVTREKGFPVRAELVARYEERTGRSLPAVRWYATLALWKSAVFLEGSYKRRLAGTTEDAFFDRLEAGVPAIAERAWETAIGGGAGRRRAG